MFRGGDYIDNPKFYQNEGAPARNTLDVSVSAAEDKWTIGHPRGQSEDRDVQCAAECIPDEATSGTITVI